MNCPHCDTENPQGARFCLNCRAKLTLACPQCGTDLPLEARFCFACGSRIDALPAPAPTGIPEDPVQRLQRLVPREFAERLLASPGPVGRERRMVTILFSDVQGSTAMAEHLDPEDVMEIMDGAFDVLIEPVYRYEGTLARLMGDAILAFFGAPIAHEDDPERAIRAALDILAGAREYAARLDRERGIPGFDVRVGINTGLVVVGEVGSDLRVEYTAMGDAVNLAARMEAAAGPGTVLITEDTHRLIAPLFETEALGPIRVKGKAEPVPVYRVLAARQMATKLRGIAGLQSPLVGREPELRALQHAVGRLQVGVGSIVTVVGEAGIGKSRLVAELRERLGAHFPDPSYLRWVEGLCLSYGTSIAYLLWLDVLRGLMGVSLEDAPGAVRETLREVVGSLCPDHSDDVYPFLGRMLSLPLEEEVGAALDNLEGEQLKAGTFRAVEALIEAAAADRPLVVVCEDLHWADPTSLELLEHLLPLAGRASLLLLCLFRPQRGHGCWRIREIASRDHGPYHTDLRLDALSAAEGEALVGNLLQTGGMPQDLVDRMLEHAEGNPFYLEEILRSLMDEEILVQDEATGRWVARPGLSDITIPGTLQGVLVARIDRLQEETRRVLQMASVIGRVFLYRVLAAIAAVEAAIEGERLDERLGSLEREEMIRQRARLPELEYIFKHHLTQEAAYNGLLKRDRRDYHRQVGEVLERLFPERIEEWVGLLAHHWERAGDPDKAVAYLLRAGDQARLAYAHEEAVAYYRRALGLLEKQDDPEQAARLLMKLGLTYHTAFKFRQARQAYEEGLALWQRASQLPARPAGELPPAPHALRLPHHDFATLDFTAHIDTHAAAIGGKLFSPLLELTPDFDVVPDVARNWEVLDGGRTYVFHLRQDVHWSDGRPVTASDFEYTCKRMLDPATGSPRATILYDIKAARAFHQGEVSDPDQLGVRCPDPWTLVAELEEPTPHFLHALGTYLHPVPKHVVEAHGASWAEPGSIVTNGPFRLESWRRGESLVLVRNPEYHGRRAGNVERVEVCFPRDLSSSVALYEADLIDWMVLYPTVDPEVDRVRQRHADEYVIAPEHATELLLFDLYRPPFDDPRLRQALVLATDRETLAEVVMRGYYAPATGGLVPPGMPGYSPGVALPYAPERARQLLAEAGYPQGHGFPAVDAMTTVGRRAQCEYLQAQWRQNLDIDISWHTMESRDYFAYLRAPSEQLPHLSIYSLTPGFLDPSALLPLRAAKGGLLWRNETYEGLLAQAMQVMDQRERIDLYRQADRLQIEQAVILPLLYDSSHWLKKPWVRGFNVRLGYVHRWDVIIEPH